METQTPKEIVENITITVESVRDGWMAILRWPGKNDLASAPYATFQEARQQAMEMKRILFETVTDTQGAEVVSVKEDDPYGED